ncbi:MAG: hypothetical protein NVS3B10_09430 [Polyangiales bacterium]
MNYKNRTLHIPPPPSLPRFSQRERDARAVEALDPLDAAATSQRPTLRPGRSRPQPVRSVAAGAPISADATAEVQVEDILLEVYAEESPPPMTRRSPGVAPRTAASLAASDGESVGARESIAMAIASIVPPPPAQSAAVDALLRASDPAFAPYAMRLAHAGSRAAHDDTQTPSVGPMTIATNPTSARPVLTGARDVGVGVGGARAKRRGAALAMWAAAIVVLGIVAGGAVVMAVRTTSPSTYARLRDSGKPAAAARAASKDDGAVAAGALAASAGAPVVPPPAALVVPAFPTAPAAIPTVSIDSLPKPAVGADESLVTFPAYAEGHRVFLDGRVLPVVEGTPTKIKCGRHMLKIGSARRPRAVDFACGREVIVQ